MATDVKADLTWGKQLRHLRNRLGLTQGQLVDTLAGLTFDAAVAAEDEWRALGIQEEVTVYLGEILDVSTLSRLEQGKRTLHPRARHIALVWAFCHLGAMTAVDEANQWLELGEQGHLTETELATLFGPTREPVPLPETQNAFAIVTAAPAAAKKVDVAIVPDRVSFPRPAPPPGHILLPRWTLLAGGALLVGLLLLLSLPLFRPVRAPAVSTAPTVWEPFDGDQLDPDLWQPSVAAWHGAVRDGVLHVDFPLNHGDAVEEEVDYLGAIGRIERIQWRTIVATSTRYQSGFLGVQTGCFDDQGWLKLLVGGSPPQLRLAYDPDDNPGGVTETPLLSLEPDRLYEIAVDWRPYELAIVVNDQALPPEPTACNWTAFFNLSANVEQGQALRGQVDEIGVWYAAAVGE
jgi:transcriptional regulator with XRE-family HTH domain